MSQAPCYSVSVVIKKTAFLLYSDLDGTLLHPEEELLAAGYSIEPYAPSEVCSVQLSKYQPGTPFASKGMSYVPMVRRVVA